MAERPPWSTRLVNVDQSAPDVNSAPTRLLAPPEITREALAPMPGTELLASLGVVVVRQLPPEPRLLEVDQVAAALGVARGTIYRLAGQKRIPCVRVGRAVRFELDAVVAALRSETNEPAAPVSLARPAKSTSRPRCSPLATGPTSVPQPLPESHDERVLAVVAVTRALSRK